MNQSIRNLYLLIFLITCVVGTQAQVALPEQVCVGTTQHYWVNGLPGSVYTWRVDGVVQSATSNEINIQWLNVGTFTLDVQEHQGNCDGAIQTGLVTVTDLAIPEFTVANEYCAGAVITALPAISNNGINGTWSPAINNTQTTLYTFIPDDNQCAAQATLTITINDQVIPQFPQVGPYCAGAAIAALPITSTNGIAGSWNPAIDNTRTTTYTFTPDNSQCTRSTSMTIVINNPVVPTFEAIAPVCSGTPISLPAASIEGVTGTWSPAINNTATTRYTFTPEASYPCSATAELTITILDQIEPIFAQVGPYCAGVAIADLPTTSTNGITGTWAPAINNTATTTYTFTPDPGQCGTTVTMTITISNEITPTFAQVGPYCEGFAIPDLPTTSTNGIAGSWSPEIDNTRTTTYTFTSDNSQCATTVSMTIVINNQAVPTFEAIAPVCSGTPINLPAASIEGITGTWSPAINNTATTTYTFTPDANYPCSSTAELTITILDQIEPVFAQVGPYCAGATIADLPTTSTNGITGTWAPAIDNTQTTQYTFTPDPGQCGTTASLTITISDEITPTFASVGPYCAGAAVADLPTTSNNGITGTWAPAIDNTQTTEYTFTPNANQCAIPTTLTIAISNEITPTFAQVGPYCASFAIPDLPTTSTNGISGSWAPAINNAVTTTYTFTPDPGQCGTITTLTITISDEITPTFAQVGPYCAGFAIPDLPTTSTNGISGSWAPAINNAVTTTYTFTPDPGQCGTTTTLTITISDEITPTFTQVGPYCGGAAIADLPTTSTNGITGSWAPAINNAITTTYTFTPDPGQCGTTATLIITISDEITPTFASVGPYCAGAAIVDLPTTSTNSITGTWAPAIDNTQTTEYTFTPNSGQCAIPTTLTIAISNEITPTFASVGPYCAGFAIPDLPSTSTNGITGSWAPAIDNTQTTQYTFTPDPGQCGTTTTMTITISDEITPTFASVGPYCAGAVIADLPTTSTNSITGTWAPAIDNTQTTEYTFTPNANQCAIPTTLTIAISNEITPTFASVGPYCAGFAIPDLPSTSTNGITGSWAPAIDNTQTTQYTFTPDPGQCGTTTTMTITISDEITPTFASVGPYCAGAAIADLPTTSTNGITGSWAPAINNAITTTYTFTPDPGQCGTTTTMTITISDEITPTFASVGPYCTGAVIADLPTTSTNGITGTWAPAIDNTQTTQYTFTPNPEQCGTTATLTITISNEITPTFAQVGPYCAGAAIADLPTTSTNGITGTWAPAIDNKQTTQYTFTPDPGQCGTTATLTITISNEITPTFAQVGPYCAGAAIADLPTTSTNGITGLWAPAIDNTQTTQYTFTPDPGQCGTTTTLTITISDEITPTFAQVGPYCAGAAIADLPTTSTNGITGSWLPAINNTQNTTYTFSPDAGQCGTTATLTIVINDEIIPVFDPVGPYNSGSLIADLPTTSINGITGLWNPAINNTQTTIYTFTPDQGQCAVQTSLTIEINGEIIPLFDPIGPLCSGAAIALPTTSTNGITGSWSPAINNTQTTTYTFSPDAGQGAETATLTIEITNGITPVFDPVGPLCSGTAFSLPSNSNNNISGSWNPAIDNTQTTTYTFTPDAGQCSTTVTLTVSISDEITPVFAAVGPYCAGMAIADLPTTSNNGITGSWSPEINNTLTTEYTFTPDAGQCGVPTTLTIEITDGIAPTFDPIGPLCAGSAIILPATSTNGITGTWTPAINNTETTTYTFTPDGGQCGIPTTLTVTISNEITPTFEVADTYCAGASIDALPTTSTNGISGSWSPAINNTQTTEYTFIPDPGQCGTSTTLTITISNEIIPIFEAVGPSCAGASIGDLPTTSTNGITGSWSPAIDNSRTTTYTFTPDPEQCAVTANLTIEITNGIIPVFDATGPYCPGDAIAELPTTSNNGISGSWSPAINNQLTTTYTFTPDDGQCAVSTTLTIAINPGVIPVFDPAGTYCPGATIADLPTTSNNGINGSWSPEIDNTRTTTYTFTPDGGQCATTATLTIVIEQGTVPVFDPVGNYCPGAAIADLPTTSNNGINGSWSPAIDNTRTTTYTFTPDGGQCATTATLTIIIDQSVIPTFDAVGPYCPGSNVPDLSTISNNGINGSWSPAIDNSRTTTYTFTPDAGQCATTATLTIVMEGTILPEFDAIAAICSGEELALPSVSNNGISGSWSPAINNTQTTTYTFQPDAGQCGTTTTLTVEVNRRDTPEFDAVGPYCPGDNISDLPSVSNNGISGSWSPAINNQQTTTYTYTPDGGLCASTTTLTIVINQGIIPTFDSVGPYCQGDAINDLPTTSNNGISGSWSPGIDNTQSGTYTFTPDEGQCATTTLLSVVIEQSILPTFDPLGPYCPGADIPALPTVSNNGISGSWSPGIDNSQTTTYTFRADNGLCPATATLTIVIDQGVGPIFNPVGPFCPGTEIAALPTVSTNGISGSWSPEIDNTQTTTYTFTPGEGQCGSPIDLTIEITDQINPTFDAISPVCSGTRITLPVASREGIAGTWSPAVDNTQTTTYTFTPDGGACASTATLTVEVLNSTIPEFSSVGPFCPGADIADLPRVSNNGIRGSWSPAINNMMTSTYTFIPEDGQCAEITTLTIEIQESITPTFEPAGTYCRGASISSLPTVSSEGISGSWSPDINNQQSTTYTFTPDGGQCASVATLTILITDQLIPEFDEAGIYCPGDNIAALPTTSNNGISGSWSPAIDNTRTTTYTFTPDEGQCAASASLTIVVDANIVPQFDAMAPVCSGGSIQLPDASNNGISGSWSPAINNTQTTTYTFTPDPGQCATTASLTVEVEQSILPTFDPVGPYCPGTTIADLPTTSNNGVSGSWSPEIDNTRTTTYTFTPDNGQCVSTASLTIVIDQSTVPTFDQPGTYCPGAAIAALPTVSNNGFSGSWSPEIDNTRTTTYTFTPDDGQCATTATVTIFIDQSILPTFDARSPYCPGENIPDLPTVSNNGISGSWNPAINNQRTTTYSFTPDAGQCGSVTTLTIDINQGSLPVFAAVGPYCPGDNIPDLPTLSDNGIRGSWSPAINNQQTTTYTFTPEAGACGSSTTLTIVINQPVIPTFASVVPYCAGSAIAELPTVSNNGIRGSWSPAINNIQTTTYTFTPDAGQCGQVTTLTINVNDEISPVFTQMGPYCAGSAIPALPTVSNNGIRGSWSPAMDNTQTTTYTFTPNAGQCGTPVTLTIEISDEITPVFDPMGPYCRGANIILPTVSNNNIRGSWSPAINNQQTTTYTFTPNSGQCGVSTTLTVEISDQITPLFDPIGPFCHGATITALPTVSNNGISGTWRPAINNTQTTTYTFTPDAGQCGSTTTLTVVISDEILPAFTAVGPYCAGATIDPLPTTSNNGITGSWSPAINNQQSTTYTFTPDAGQCGMSTSLTITISDEVTPTFNPPAAYCMDSAIPALPTISNNGIRGSWSPVINNQQTTTYTFTPNAGQCGTTASLTIEISDEIIPTFDPVGPYTSGSAIPALPTVSNNGIRGTWSPAINNQQTTTYTFTPNSGQCAVATSLTIEITNMVIPTFDPVGPYCAGSVIAALPTVSNNGIRGTWSPAINNQQTTTYTFTPDAGQSAGIARLTITIDNEIRPTFATVGPYCAGAAIDDLPITSNNGITGSWSPAINNQQTTTYTFTPDAGQCGMSTTLTITISDEVTPSFNPPAAYCMGAAIPALPTISNNGIRGTWSPAINNLQTTTYTFTPNSGQCGTTASLTIEISDEIIPTFDPVGPYTSGSAIPTLPTTSNNGIRGTWSPAINNLQTTTYTFTPNSGQCAVTTTLTIDISDLVIPTFDPAGPYCAGSVIAALPTTSNNGISGTWSPAINNTQTTTYTFTPNAGQSADIARLTITIEDEIIPTFDPVGPYTLGSAIPALPTVSNNGIRGTWSPAINNLQTTTYTFTPNSGQCAVATTLTIDISDLVIPTFDPAGPYCAGSVIAALPVVSNNGIRGTWSPTINNLQTTTYTFTPDAGQSAGIARLTITIEDEIIPSFDPVGPYTHGSAIPALPTVSNNGISGTWSPAINNLQTTTYTFTPDAGQCAVATTLTIDISDLLIPTFDPVGPYCAGSVIAALPTTSNNGISGTWSPAIDNTQTTTYTFTPDAGQSAGIARLTITIEDEIIPSFDALGPYCAGAAIDDLPTVSNNGISGSWSPAINNTRTTIYTFIPNDGQCASLATMTIEIDPVITPAFDPAGPFCRGTVIAALPTVSSNGIQGTWRPAVNNTQTTTYTFTPTDGQCAEPVAMTIEVSDEILPTFDPAGPFCPGAVIAALPTTSNNGIHGSWSPAINNSQTTTYTFTPEGGQCGITTTMTIAIEENAIPTFDPVGPYCAGSAIADLPTVSNNAIRGTWRPGINNRRTTTYTFTPDEGQCGSATTLTIVITDEIVPTFDPVGPYCPDAVIANLSTVSNNGITGTWDPAIDNTRSTTYTFTPDPGQCATTSTLRIVIDQRTRPTFDQVASYCRGSSISALRTVSNNGIRGRWRPAINNTQTTTYTFTPDPGQCGESTTMTIQITDEVVPIFDPVGPYPRGAAIATLRTVSNNGISGRWRPAINNRQTTTYTFTPDAGQCSMPVSMTIVITDDIIPVFDPVGAYCPGSVIADLPVVSNNGIRGTWSPAINNQQTTTYTFTPDAGQSAAIVTMTIAISGENIPTFNPVGPFCPGSVIADLPVVSTNGISGSWSPAINNQQTTIYTFTPDGGQCGTTTTLTIDISDEITPTFDQRGPFCPGSVIADLPAVSNNGIRGTWSPALNNQQTTIYTFTPDAAQCGTTTTLTIDISDEIIPTFDPVRPYCPGSAIADLPVVSNNGIRGTWSPAINNQQTTTYTFTPDAGQCALTSALTIEIGIDIVPEFDLVGPFCPGADINALPVVSKNGVFGTWSPVINNMVTTNYLFTPQDGQCATSASIICEIGSEITPVFNQRGPYCEGSTIEALPNTSINGVLGTWSPSIDNMHTTTYTFTPAPGRCALPTDMTINILEEANPTFAPVEPYCEGETIAALPTTSLNGITGTWSPALNNTQTTTYTFTPDAGQCAGNTTMVIAISQKVTPTFAPVASYCPGSVIPNLPVVSDNGIRGTWSPAINNRVTTTYTFTPAADQCANIATLTIEIKESIVPVFAQPDIYCVGTTIPDLPGTSNNGITGSWSPSLNTTQTTTYTFTPVDGQCATTAELTILINSQPVLPVARVIQPDCNILTGTIELVSPRGTQYQYRLDGGNYQIAALFNGLSPQSSHTIQVKDILTGCESETASVTINSLPQPPSVPVAIVVVNPKCDGGGSIEVTDPTGIDYEYSIDGGAYQSMVTFTNVTWGEHLITVRNKSNGCESSAAKVFIPDVTQDMDYDGIADALDLDVDGDGIINSYDGTTADLDNDGNMNYMDIDADGDGIVDNVEVQNVNDYILPSYSDDDNDGLDDAYDTDQEGMEIIPVDSDKDGTPDFLDFDSDNDLVPDFIEGHDEDSNGKPDHYAINKDSDFDGLDDGYDLIFNACGVLNNPLGSNAATQDFDGDGIPDWRDDNDDDDEYLTRYEDLNADGDFSNDDIDFDGYPEYLDYGRDCDLFIPDAFSPNGDNVHDLYMIYCINHYPNATMYIFDQLGNKIYEKAHYGNLEFWKTPATAWWDAKPTRGPGYSRNDRVPPGTYYYVLDLGNGQVKKSYVFVSY